MMSASSRPAAPSRILLVQTSFLGDTILSTPVIAALKGLYPSASLHMMTTPLSAGLVERDPLLDGVIRYDKRGEHSGVQGLLGMSRTLRGMGFDRAYSLHRSYRTALLLWLSRIPVRIGFSQARMSFLYTGTRRRVADHHDVVRNMSLLAGELGDTAAETMRLRLFPPGQKELGTGFLDRLPAKEYAVLVPGSAWETKMWQWRGFRDVALHLIQRGMDVVLLGAESDRAVSSRVEGAAGTILNLAGRTTIPEAMHVVSRASLMVCNDSMSLHMASAFHVPTVAVFCATSPEFGFGPWQNRAEVVEHQGLDCRPCRRHGSRVCPTGTEACMKELGSDEVIRAVDRLLKN